MRQEATLPTENTTKHGWIWKIREERWTRENRTPRRRYNKKGEEKKLGVGRSSGRTGAQLKIGSETDVKK